MDYDTDALRAELTTFGENPGPITKSTKKLYMKRLLKIKRNPEKYLPQISEDKKDPSKFFFSLSNLVMIFNKILKLKCLEINLRCE